MLRTLALLRELYNAALQERRDAYKRTGKSPSCYDQQKSIIEVRELRPEFEDIHTHLLQDALSRLDRAFKSFFRRCKAGEEPGYPRFKGRGQYNTFTFKDAANGNGAKLAAGNKRLSITGIGKVKIKLHRPHQGRIKQISVTLDGDGHWYACLSCDEVPAKPLPATTSHIGVDVGIEAFATGSDRSRIENPRLLQRAQREVARAQRRVSRRKRGSSRRREAVRILARKHANVRNSRTNFLHKVARSLVEKHQSITVEDLNIKGLASGMLAKQVSDVSWAQFTTILAAKAEWAGREFIPVDPRGSSQECSRCHAYVPKPLGVRTHRCDSCGLVVHRDINAARVLQTRGRRVRGGALNAAAEDPRSPCLGR